MRRRYLLTLEIAPVRTKLTYDELPSHLTIMSRFFSHIPPEQVAGLIRPLCKQTKPIELMFEQTAELGPKNIVAHMVRYSDELKQLHNALHSLLDTAHVEYEYSQFIGDNFKPHVTKRDGDQYAAGDKKIVKTVCLIEVVDRQRVIRARLALADGL